MRFVDFLAAAGQTLVADPAAGPDRLRRLALPVASRASPATRCWSAPSGWSTTAGSTPRDLADCPTSPTDGSISAPVIAVQAAPAPPRLRAASARRRAHGVRGVPRASTRRWLDDYAPVHGPQGRPRRGRPGRLGAGPGRAASRRPSTAGAAKLADGDRAVTSSSSSSSSASGGRCKRRANERGVRIDRRPADLRRPRQRRRLGAPRPVLARRRRPADGRGRRAARLLQRRPASSGATRSTLGAHARATAIAWWIARLRATLEPVDLVRLDHFRGFEAVLGGPGRASTTAIDGRWVPGAGRASSSRRSATRSAACRSSPRTWA